MSKPSPRAVGPGSNQHAARLHPRPVHGLDQTFPSTALLTDGGRTHVICHEDRISAYALRSEGAGHRAHYLWRHGLPGRVVDAVAFGLDKVAALLEVDGEALLVVVDDQGWHQIAAAHGKPTALCALGAQLAFAVLDQNQNCSIRIVQGSSGRSVATLRAPVGVSEFSFDARLNEILAFSRDTGRICWIPINDRCDWGNPAYAVNPIATSGRMQALAVTSVLAKPEVTPCCPCGRSTVPYGSKCDCSCATSGSGPGGSSGGSGPAGGGGTSGGGGTGHSSNNGWPCCMPGGPGIVDGCYEFVVVDGRRVVRVDLCRPGLPCAITVDRPIQQLRKAGSYLIAQGDGGQYMAQIDPATTKVVQARAFPRGGAVFASHVESDILLLFDRRQRSWQSLDLAAAVPDLR